MQGPSAGLNEELAGDVGSHTKEETRGPDSSNFPVVPNIWVSLVAKSCLTLLEPHRLQPARLLCPWDFPGKNIGVGCHFLLQWIFSTQGLNPHFLHWQAGSLIIESPRKPLKVRTIYHFYIKQDVYIYLFFSRFLEKKGISLGEKVPIILLPRTSWFAMKMLWFHHGSNAQILVKSSLLCVNMSEAKIGNITQHCISVPGDVRQNS